MATVIVPVCAIEYPDDKTYAIEAVEIFYDAGLLNDDCYTSTVLVSVLHERDREEMRRTLRDRLTSADAERLIKYLESHDWDVSFLVDGRD